MRSRYIWLIVLAITVIGIMLGYFFLPLLTPDQHIIVAKTVGGISVALSLVAAVAIFISSIIQKFTEEKDGEDTSDS